MDHPHNGIHPSRSDIMELVLSSLEEVLAMADGKSSAVIGEETYLIGRDAVLDSMGLVTLIVDVEQRLEEEYGAVLVLADERAMSQKHSPFRSVRSLTDYICRLMEQQG